MKHKPSNDEIYNALTNAILTVGSEWDEEVLGYLRDNLDKLLAPQWQPIEAAPKDGNYIIGDVGDRSRVIRWSRDWCCWMGYSDYGYPTDFHPTRYQSLPQPPTEDTP